MSDSKRATLITVGAPKSAKKSVTKTVRLTINLDESNESKYPELNYKELVIVTERKQRTENGKPAGLDPYSDNDDDVERVARKFEQKYGSRSTYGRKKRSKRDDFADIGAGYDENDSFIDNTDGYDEMIPPECDTLYGGFYINSGSLEFKTVPENQVAVSDGETPVNNRRNKRRISSSTSDDESSDSSSESESQDEKDPNANMVNGNVDSHKTEHRKKKNKKSDKKNAKRIRRADSSAATSGKQTSDDNVHGDAESADSRTSQSDSLTSKPAPSSENAITSDSSRDAEAKSDVKLPSSVVQMLEELSGCVSRLKQASPSITAKEFETSTDSYVIRLERVLSACLEARVQRTSWTRAAHTLDTSRTKLMQRARALTANHTHDTAHATVITAVSTTNHIPAQMAQVPSEKKHNRKEEELDEFDISRLTSEQKEQKIVETLKRLKALIDERKPSMMQNYKAECERVQEERKKIMIATAADGAPHIEKRLPKRRFPWCQRTRVLLARLTRLAGAEASAARLLAQRALPLFPAGFVRIPTLLRQANLNKDLTAHIKPSELRKQTSMGMPAPTLATVPPPVTVPQHTFSEPIIHFPSSLTVTTTLKPTDIANDTNEDDRSKTQKAPKQTSNTNNSSASKQESQNQYPTIFNAFNLNKDIIEVTSEKDDKNRSSKEAVVVEKGPDKVQISFESDNYVPPNNIGSITITPVPNTLKNDIRQQNKSVSNSINIATDPKQKEPTIRVKSQATLSKEADELLKREKEKHKSKNFDKPHSKPEKRVHSPLHIDTSHPKEQKKIDVQKVSPGFAKSDHKDEVSQKKIDSMRTVEDNIPRPALIPVHLSPTFVKPDKRPPDPKKPKKDVLIISDMDPLADTPQEPLAVDDSSSDVEVIEDLSGKSEPLTTEPKKNDPKPNSDVKKHSDSRHSDATVPSNRDKSSIVNYKKHDSSHNLHQSKHSLKDKTKTHERTHGSKDSKMIHDAQRKQNHALEKMDVDDTEADIHKVMQNLREMQDSQEHTFNSNSYGGVITSEQASLNKMDGCSAVTG